MRTAKIGILDYGVGNLLSISNALSRIGYDSSIVGIDRDNPRLSHLIIPGVGSFGYCRNQLENSDLLNLVSEYVLIDEIRTLGICVGMQLMFEASEESPNAKGLRWFDGIVTQIEATEKHRVPHVGWNCVNFHHDTLGFYVDESPNFYFDHSFAYPDIKSKYSVATCNHSENFAAVIEKDNIVGVQFHPEKSQKNGLKLLKNFIEK